MSAIGIVQDAGAITARGAFAGSAVGEVLFGAGCVAELGRLLARDGIERVVIVTGRTLAGTPALIDRLTAAAGGRCIAVHSATVPHVPRQSALALAQVLRSLRADAIVTFGGSTPGDTAKAAAWAVADGFTQPGEFDACAIRTDASGRRIVPSMRGKPPLIYAVPTTLSAGEFTDIAGITDTDHGEKLLHRDRRLGARAVILDPEMTLATPEWLWLSSGVKAIDHCVEAWFSISAQPLTSALAVEALASLMRHLPRTRLTPADLESRLQAQIAAWLSVFGLGNVSLGLSHGLGHQLGARCGIAHGHTSCVMLQHVVGFNALETAARREELCRRLGAALGRPLAAADLQGELLRLVRDDLGLPWRLRDLGVEQAALPAVAAAALRDPIVATNPRSVQSEDDVLSLLRSAW